MANDQYMTANCRAAQGKPNTEHHCTGCPGCPCHHKAAPPNFRALVEAAQTQRQEVTSA